MPGGLAAPVHVARLSRHLYARHDLTNHLLDQGRPVVGVVLQNKAIQLQQLQVGVLAVAEVHLAGGGEGNRHHSGTWHRSGKTWHNMEATQCWQ